MNAERSMAHVWLALVASLVVGFVVAAASAADDPVALNGEESATSVEGVSSLPIEQAAVESGPPRRPLIL